VPVVRMNGRVIILPGVPRLCEVRRMRSSTCGRADVLRRRSSMAWRNTRQSTRCGPLFAWPTCTTLIDKCTEPPAAVPPARAHQVAREQH
jgi:hypothetical protein